ncbi:hypothetical protein [Fodinicola acaciae]|uniref:hypothetical protein n=1 Tax=Fodinicola acaciae TaxID=2681555 RepID=UPI0013D483E5|nr:hypothetical protein [Fodinicola acaciae]
MTVAARSSAGNSDDVQAIDWLCVIGERDPNGYVDFRAVQTTIEGANGDRFVFGDFPEQDVDGGADLADVVDFSADLRDPLRRQRCDFRVSLVTINPVSIDRSRRATSASRPVWAWMRCSSSAWRSRSMPRNSASDTLSSSIAAHKCPRYSTWRPHLRP